VRGLFGLVLAACLIGLAGPRPVHAADDSPTPGLWINPELGLATPKDAAARYRAPFHTWRIDEDDPRREEPDWRERAFLLFGGDWSEALEGWSRSARQELWETQQEKHKLGHWFGRHWPAEIPPPPPGPTPLRVQSCADLLAAYRANLHPHPALESAWHGSRLNFFHLGLYLFYDCVALEHLARLQPLEGDAGEVPAFQGDRATVLRLSPVVFNQSPSEAVQRDLITELSDTPHLENARKVGGRPHADDQFIEGPWWPDPGVYWDAVCRFDYSPPAVWEPIFEKFCTDDDVLARVPAWAVTTAGGAQRAAGFSFTTEIRVEGEDGAYILTVLGVGTLPEADRLTLVVMAIDD
jgi:hypothetical protein